MRAKDCWVRAHTATAITVYLYLCVFFLYFFIYFQRFSFDFQPNLPTFIFICYRFNTNPLLFFFYSYRLSLVHMYAQRICLSHGHRLNSTHKPHWIALTEPVQSKYTLIQKRIYSYFIFDNVRQIYIYTIFWFCFIFVVLGIFLGSVDEVSSFSFSLRPWKSRYSHAFYRFNSNRLHFENNREREREKNRLNLCQYKWIESFTMGTIDPMCIQLILHFSNMIFI